VTGIARAEAGRKFVVVNWKIDRIPRRSGKSWTAPPLVICCPAFCSPASWSAMSELCPKTRVHACDYCPGGRNVGVPERPA